jgi:hypothetical protein
MTSDKKKQPELDSQPAETECLHGGASCVVATWWELWWAKHKFWHTANMTERHFHLVINEFDCLPIPEKYDKENLAHWNKANEKKLCLDQQIKLRLKLNPTEVFGLELLVLHLMSDERLLSKAWSIREAYRRLVPDDMYRKYEESKPPSFCRDVLDNVVIVSAKVIAANEAYRAKVRADAEDLLNATHWWYTNSNYREQRIQSVKRKLCVGLFLCTSLVVILSACNKTEPSAALVLLTVVLMGGMGAILSIGRRMLPVSSQNVTESDPIIKATQFDHGGIGILLSIFAGGAAALVLYLLMVAGLHRLGDQLMPQFVSPCLYSDWCNLSLNSFFASLIPVDTKSFAMVLCWSFVAGFAEKFVPDILDRMGKNDKNSAK